MAEKSFISTS